MNGHLKFEKGNVYQMRFITDNDLRPEYICTKVTAKTASFQRFKSPDSEVITRRIQTTGRMGEYVRVGNYSMAPTINTKDIVA